MSVKRGSRRISLLKCARNKADSEKLAVEWLAGECDQGQRGGRAVHHDPEVDDECFVVDPGMVGVGDVLLCRVIDTDGVDLIVPSQGNRPEQDGFGERP